MVEKKPFWTRFRMQIQDDPVLAAISPRLPGAQRVAYVVLRWGVFRSKLLAYNRMDLSSDGVIGETPNH